MFKIKYAPLTEIELEALEAFRDEHKRNWRMELCNVYWYNARIWVPRDISKQGNGYGYIIHGLRNSHGPSWLDGFKFPK